MNYCQIIKADIANGIGIRLSLFVSGCRNHCEGCFQPETWDFNYGNKYSEETEQEILDELSKKFYKGITILGGDPLEPENQEQVALLISKIKVLYPDKDVWIYTGYNYEDILSKDWKNRTKYTSCIIANTDILVDGRFELDKKDITLKFKGSSNQRVIDVQSSIREKEVVLSEYN